jgi:ABC-type uncharacterized transport system substrate-binding protein
MWKKTVLVCSVFILAATSAVFAQKYGGKKVLYIDSYHAGYEWSDGITKGIEDTLKGTGVTLNIFRMDTKRNGSEEAKQQAAQGAKKAIEEFKPDVVIVSDDNAAKYVVAASYKDAKLPFVFCGVNWDASVYGMPYSNVTGMVEVSLTNEIISNLKAYAKGDRVGYLSADTETERKNEVFYNKILKISFAKSYYAKTLEEWKQAFLKLQDEVDMIIIENNAGISDWDNKAAEEFALANTKVPAGTTNPWMVPFSLLGITKIAEEQGIWSAQTALTIMDGTSPASIPIVSNKQGKFSLNMKIAGKIGVVFKPTLLKHAEIIK